MFGKLIQSKAPGVGLMENPKVGQTVWHGGCGLFSSPETKPSTWLETVNFGTKMTVLEIQPEVSGCFMKVRLESGKEGWVPWVFQGLDD